MLKPSVNLLNSARVIANRLYNPYRCSSSTTDSTKKVKQEKYRQEYRYDDGSFDVSGPTLGSGRRGPTTREVKEYIKNNPDFLQQSVKTFWEEWKLLKEEVRGKLRQEPIPPRHGTIDMVYTFENEEKLKNFVVTTDADHEIGHSTAELTTTSRETAMFSGFLCNKLKPDGLTKWAGYTNFNSKRPMLAFDRVSDHDWTDYTHVVLKIRGDGRTYNIIVGTPGYFEQQATEQYVYPLFTRGGPYWQIAKIPFSKFIFAASGYIQTKQQMFKINQVSRIGVTLADNIDGPFNLEIEYIGVARNEYHNEITAYEEYKTDAPIC